MNLEALKGEVVKVARGESAFGSIPLHELIQRSESNRISLGKKLEVVNAQCKQQSI